MRVIPFVLALAFASLPVTAQSTVVFTASVGTPQAVPDPLFPANPDGNSSLFGIFSPAAGGNPATLRFILNGLPSSYGSASPVTQETLYFMLDFGTSSLPGAPLLGGLVYLPMTAPATFTVAASSYMGPLDTVPMGGTSGGVQDPLNNGGRLDLSGLLVPAAIGVPLTIQAGLFDPVPNLLFTSNAIDFQVQ